MYGNTFCASVNAKSCGRSIRPARSGNINYKTSLFVIFFSIVLNKYHSNIYFQNTLRFLFKTHCKNRKYGCIIYAWFYNLENFPKCLVPAQRLSASWWAGFIVCFLLPQFKSFHQPGLVGTLHPERGVWEKCSCAPCLIDSSMVATKIKSSLFHKILYCRCSLHRQSAKMVHNVMFADAFT